jgi:ATP-dependent DNA ligase
LSPAPRHFVGERDAVLAATWERGLEGVVAKRLDSRYEEGRRSAAWLKHRHRRRERFVITGWVPFAPGRLESFLLARARGRIAGARRQRVVRARQQDA